MALAAEGARVVVADLNGDGAAEQAARVRSGGADAISVAVDISDEAAVESLVEQTLKAFDRIDVLHNNAAATQLGGTVDGPVREAELDVWTTSLLVNLCGTMLVTKHALGPMLDQGSGSIVNTTSGAALGGDLGHPAYSASKAGVISLTQSVATMYGKAGIRCNAVLPGLIVTERAREAFNGPRGEMFLRHHLTPRLGTSEDVAAAVVYLASDESAFVTGHVLSVDGGLSAHQPYVADLRDSGRTQVSTHD
jgi:NAD(P)-dependent dehydrogenase (short-subunit alcohol dehydrogenase family)